MLSWIALLLSIASAGQPSLVRCDDALTHVDGAAIPMPGYGATEAEAHEDAEQFGTFVALLHAQAALVPDLFGWTEGRMDAFLRVENAEGALVPGWQVKPSSCQRVDLPKLKKKQGVAASLRDERLERGDPVVAAWATRRRACHSAWAGAFTEGFERTAHAAPSDKLGELERTYAAAGDALDRCVSEPLRFEAAPSPESASVSAPTMCEVWSAEGPRSLPALVATGVGSSLERAREHATWKWTLGSALAGMGRGADMAAHAAPSQRDALIASGVSIPASMRHPSTVAEPLSLSCHRLASNETGQRWSPADPRLASDCALERFDPVGPTTGRAQGLAACRAHATADFPLIQEAVQHASADRKHALANAGVGLLYRCAGSCVAQVAPTGLERGELLSPEYDLSRPDAFVTYRDRAIETGDMAPIMALFPWMLSWPREDFETGFKKAVEREPAIELPLVELGGRMYLNPSKH